MKKVKIILYKENDRLSAVIDDGHRLTNMPVSFAATTLGLVQFEDAILGSHDEIVMTESYAAMRNEIVIQDPYLLKPSGHRKVVADSEVKHD